MIKLGFDEPRYNSRTSILTISLSSASEANTRKQLSLRKRIECLEIDVSSAGCLAKLFAQDFYDTALCQSFAYSLMYLVNLW